LTQRNNPKEETYNNNPEELTVSQQKNLQTGNPEELTHVTTRKS